MDKLVITDSFKDWMRTKLKKDRAYAERLFHAFIDEEDVTLLKVWPHAALPRKSALGDPEAMIGMLMGYDNKRGVDIVVAIFGKWEDMMDISTHYFSVIWGMNKPQRYADFEYLPYVYEIAFAELGEEEEAFKKKRMTVEMKYDDGRVEVKPFDDTKVNLINTSLGETDIVRLVCGQKVEV